MAKLVWHRIRISWLDRLPNSVNGNPRYAVHYVPLDADGNDAGDLTKTLTSSDSSCDYGLQNKDMNTDAGIMVTFTRAGRIDRACTLDEFVRLGWSE